MERDDRPGGERGALLAATTKPKYWQPALALLAVAGLYLILAQPVMLGPSWTLLALLGISLVSATLARRRGMHAISRRIGYLMVGFVTAGLAANVAVLIAQILGSGPPARELLRDALSIWLTNVLVFALWYWEIDGGGPIDRHDGTYGSEDFVFPQLMLRDDRASSWVPTFVDYLFLSFNTSTAFSPTDTLVLSRRAKLLMMIQSLISLLALAVVAARAINTLGS